MVVWILCHIVLLPHCIVFLLSTLLVFFLISFIWFTTPGWKLFAQFFAQSKNPEKLREIGGKVCPHRTTVPCTCQKQRFVYSSQLDFHYHGRKTARPSNSRRNWCKWVRNEHCYIPFLHFHFSVLTRLVIFQRCRLCHLPASSPSAHTAHPTRCTPPALYIAFDIRRRSS